MTHVIAQRHRLEYFQCRHAAIREAIADLVRHLPGEFTDNITDPSGVSRLDAIEKDGEVIGKNGAFGAMAACVVRDRNQVSPVPVAAADGDGVEGANGGGQEKMAAPETGGDLLTALVNPGRFRFGETHDAAMVATGTGAGLGWHQAEEGFPAGFVQPLYRAMRHFGGGPPTGFPA